MKYTLLYCFIVCLMATTCAGQDYVYLSPDEVDHLSIIGSDNVVIRGDDVSVQPASIAEEVRKSIEEAYQVKVDSLDQLLDAAQLDLLSHERELAGMYKEKQAAIREAFLLTEEFKALDLKQENAIYQRLEALFKAGDVSGCLSLLSDEVLEAADEKNARNRRIKARLHSVNFEFTKAEENFLAASRIYPTYASFEALANYYLSTDEMNKLKGALEQGRAVVNTTSERIFLEIGYTYLYRGTGERLSAIAKMKTCDSLVQLSNRSMVEKKKFSAAVWLESAELYNLFPGKQRQALNLAKKSRNIYKDLTKEHPESIVGFISAMHVQGKIFWGIRNTEDAYLVEMLALNTLDEYEQKLMDNSGYQTLYLDVLLMIASIQTARGKHEDASLHVDRALRRVDSLYQKHPGLALLSRIATTKYNKANHRLKAKAYEEAITTYNEAEDDFQQILAVDSAGMNKFDFLGKLYNNRGKCYEYLKNEAAARKNYQQAHDFFSARLTPNGKSMYDDNSFNAIMNLADGYFRTEEFEEAAVHYKKSLLQISLLYQTEPGYWQGIYMKHILQAGKAHFEVFKIKKKCRDFIESYRHLQSAESLMGKLAQNDETTAFKADVKTTKKVLLSHTPVFLEQAAYVETEFLDRLILKEELESSESYQQMRRAYEGFSHTAMDAVLAIKSPFYTSDSEYEDEANRKLYAWWSCNLAASHLQLGEKDKALYAAASALRYWENDQHRMLLAIMQLTVGKPSDAVKTIKTMEMKPAERAVLLEKSLETLEKSGALKIGELSLEKVYKKIG
ncbi:MAG: hypothetical protein AB8H12_14790 [Lewinella sp.]